MFKASSPPIPEDAMLRVILPHVLTAFIPDKPDITPQPHATPLRQPPERGILRGVQGNHPADGVRCALLMERYAHR